MVQADLPSFISEQNSLAPMLEKVQPAVVTLSVEGKTKVNSVSPFQDDIPEELNSSSVIVLLSNLVDAVNQNVTSVV